MKLSSFLNILMVFKQLVHLIGSGHGIHDHRPLLLRYSVFNLIIWYFDYNEEYLVIHISMQKFGTD